MTEVIRIMSEKVIMIDKDNFGEVMNGDKLVLLDFFASWCGPCKMLAPVIDKIAEEYEGKAAICKCDVDENNEIASELAVSSVPTLFFIKDKKIVDKIVGLANPKVIKTILDNNI